MGCVNLECTAATGMGNTVRPFSFIAVVLGGGRGSLPFNGGFTEDLEKELKNS